MYLISGSANFTEARPIAISTTKKEAEKFTRSLGFKYDRSQDLFVSHPGYDNGGYLKIRKIEVIGVIEDEVIITKFIQRIAQAPITGEW